MPRKPPPPPAPAEPETQPAIDATEPAPAPAPPDEPAAVDHATSLGAESDGVLSVDAAPPSASDAVTFADDPNGEPASGAFPGPARTAPRTVSELHLKGIIESLVFASDKPLSPSDIGKLARAESRDVRRLLDELREEYRGRGIQLDEVAGGWQFRSSAANAPFVRELLQAKPVRLTRAQVETLAIIAYRQPVTRPEVDDIRGVDSGSAVKLLLERELIRMLGRKEEVGRPVLYGTSGHFLEFFGLKSLRDLPTLREFTDLTPESEATLVRALEDEALAAAESPAPDATYVPLEAPMAPPVAAAAEAEAVVETEAPTADAVFDTEVAGPPPDGTESDEPVPAADSDEA